MKDRLAWALCSSIDTTRAFSKKSMHSTFHQNLTDSPIKLLTSFFSVRCGFCEKVKEQSDDMHILDPWHPFFGEFSLTSSSQLES